MNNTQDQNKPARPSLYGSNATTSTFSVLGAVAPFGWSKQNVVLASVASFIVGSVMGGGVVGLAQKSESIQESTLSTPSLNVQAVQHTIQRQQLPTQQSSKNTMNAAAVVSSAVATVAKVSQPIVPEASMIKPLSNPLASFKESSYKESPRKKISEQKLVKPISKLSAISSNDDSAMQKLITNKSINPHILANEKLEKKKIEKAFKSDNPIKDSHLPKENNPSKTTVRPKKDNARDKDVLLVKSMLDTMDHPASKPKSPPLNSTSTS